MFESVMDIVSKIIEAKEIEKLRKVHQVNRPHPLVRLTGTERPSQVAHNTARAIKLILQNNREWLVDPRFRERMLSEDVTNAAGALAEIRAYGALLEAGYQVNPIRPAKEPSPDFRIAAENGGCANVEVHAKQISGPMQDEIDKHEREIQEDFQAWRKEKGKSGGVFIAEALGIQPLGAPDPAKRGETTTINAIHSLCQVKAEEKQFAEDEVNLLWLDMQDENPWWFLSCDPSVLVEPVVSGNDGMLTSGALWYAMYGWKGAPVFDPDFPQKITCMQHEGRFHRDTKISALVASFPRATVVFENLAPKVTLSPRCRLRTMCLPRASVQYSMYDWECGLVVSTFEVQRRRILALEDNVKKHLGYIGEAWT